MKKNVIFIIVDSVYQKHCIPQPYKEVSMPFLHKLSAQGITAVNLYSQAPFTEAALTPLLSGEPLLNKGAYMNRLRYRTSMLDVFREHGYDTFINHYYPSIYPSHMFPGVSDLVYVNPFDFLHVWEYRLEYYQPLFLQGSLSEKEMAMLYDILEDNFKAWMLQYELLLARDQKVSFMQSFMQYEDAQYQESLHILKDEYAAFKQDTLMYLTRLFQEEKQHILFQIPTLYLNHKLTDAQRTEIQNRFEPVFRRIYKLNQHRNLRNTGFPIKRTIRAMLHGDWHSVYQYAAMYQNAIQDKDLFARIHGTFDQFKPQVSTNTYFKNALEWLDNRTSDKPFCMYLHLDDAHWPENFFSYDSSDLTLLEEEFCYVSEYLDRLPKSYHGALTMDLSQRYVDHCIKKLYEGLQLRGVMKDAVFVVTADHGFSFSFNPIRTNYVNNLHQENYQIPFVLIDGVHKEIVKERYFTTVDIAPTILDAAGVEVPECMSGISMLNSDGKDYAISEYMGGGCPDMLRRPLLLTVRTKQKSVAIEIFLHDKFFQHKLRHVYDLQNDPKEYRNLAEHINVSCIQEELLILQQRFEQIQKDFKETSHAFR